MQRYILEACVDSVESALAAVQGGADRLELCSNLIIGGTTPGPALFQEIRKETGIRIHVLIRPRFGDFCYSDYEFGIMRKEVRMFREMGAEGVVIGILKPDGSLNTEQMGSLIEEAGALSVTLHRAFDVCRDPWQALEQAKQLGIHTILTSGQQNSCLEGKELLRDLVQGAGAGMDIMIGSGVDAAVIRQLAPYTDAHSFHMSGKSTRESAMLYRPDGISMGLPVADEFVLWRTEKKKIREARAVLDELSLSDAEKV